MNVVSLEDHRQTRRPRVVNKTNWWIILDDGSLRYGPLMEALQKIHLAEHCWQEDVGDGEMVWKSSESLSAHACPSCDNAMREIAWRGEPGQSGSGPYNTPFAIWPSQLRALHPIDPPIPTALRMAVFKRDGHTCQGTNCGTTERLVLAKRVALQDGGTIDEDNLVVLCRTCVSMLLKQRARTRRAARREAQSQTS